MEKKKYSSVPPQKKTYSKDIFIIFEIIDVERRVIIFKTCLHSVRFVGFNFRYPPALCHWTTPSAPSGWAQIDLNYNLRVLISWPEPVLVRVWDDTLRTLSDT